MPSPTLLQRLKERKLVQWALAYLAGAWVLIEVPDAVGGRLGWPDTIYQGLLITLAMGFFNTLVLAWYGGEKGRHRTSARVDGEVMMRPFVSAVLVLTVLAACQPAATNLTEEQRTQIEQQVRGLEDRLLASATNVDAEGFLSFFEQSDDLTFAEFGAVHRSWSTWEGIVRRGFARIGEAEVERCEWSDRHYQVLAQSVAVSTAVLRCYGPAAAGSPTLVDHSWSAVWAFGDGRWRIVNFAETYPPPESGG